jgi:sugar-specific transcriptional regulator TrmB
MNLTNQLKLVGLNKSEIRIYLYILENGLSNPPQVSRGTKITRTNCYHVLCSLKEKGLIQEQLNNNRKVYLPTDPESLVRNWQQKKEAIEQILPDLHGLYTTQKNKPKIKFYDGIDQVREIYLQSLKADEIMAIGSTKNIQKLLPDFLKYYFSEIRRRGIIFKNNLTSDSEATAQTIYNDLKDFYNFKLLPREYQNPTTDILIWGNNIAFITFQEPAFGTILSDDMIAQNFKMLFDLLWSK